jgi:hypothetical protein
VVVDAVAVVAVAEVERGDRRLLDRMVIVSVQIVGTKSSMWQENPVLRSSVQNVGLK